MTEWEVAASELASSSSPNRNELLLLFPAPSSSLSPKRDGRLAVAAPLSSSPPKTADSDVRPLSFGLIMDRGVCRSWLFTPFVGEDKPMTLWWPLLPMANCCDGYSCNVSDAIQAIGGRGFRGSCGLVTRRRLIRGEGREVMVGFRLRRGG